MFTLDYVSMWKQHCHEIPDVLAQPFHIFGILAVAETQVKEQKRHARPSSAKERSKSRSTSRPRARIMTTRSLGSVLAMYRHLPRAWYRLSKAILVNMVAERVAYTARMYLARRLARRFSMPDSARLGLLLLGDVLAAVATSPLKLLCTELSVFRRFDWRCLQLNKKILPIFLPNVLDGVFDVALSTLTTPLLEQLSLFVSQISHGPGWPLYAIGARSSILLGGMLLLISARACVTIFHVRRDLLVLNGDSAHSILPLDETYEGGIAEALGNKPDYSVSNTLRRLARISILPQFLIHAVSALALPFIDLLLRPTLS